MMNLYKNDHIRSSGFTIVEVGIIVPIIMLVALALFEVLFSFVHSTAVEKGRVDIAYEKQTAINTVESDVRLATSFLTTKEANMPDPYSNFPDSGPWSYAGDGTNRVLILQSNATSDNPLTGSRQPVYIGSGAACTPANLQYDNLLSYDTVYFVKNSVLYRRRLVDPGPPATSTQTCAPQQYQKLSCPTVDQLAPATRNASCGANDEVVARDVSGFNVDYYTDGSSTTKLDAYGADSGAVTAASSIGVTLSMGRKIAGETVTGSSSLRVARINMGAN